MTTVKKLSISVPQDVAETLEQQGPGRASAYVTEAVRAHRAWESYQAMMADAGVQLTEEGMAASRARRYEIQAQWPKERSEGVRERVRQHLADKRAGRQAPAA